MLFLAGYIMFSTLILVGYMKQPAFKEAVKTAVQCSPRRVIWIAESAALALVGTL